MKLLLKSNFECEGRAGGDRSDRVFLDLQNVKREREKHKKRSFIFFRAFSRIAIMIDWKERDHLEELLGREFSRHCRHLLPRWAGAEGKR